MDISVGGSHSCAVATEGEIVCWGRDIGEQPPLGRYKAVSTSGVHACALKQAGEAVCWGNQWDRDDFGQTDAPPGRYVATSVGHRAGKGAHPTNSCALTVDGEAVCWGYASDGVTRLAGPYTDLASAAGAGFCAIRGGRAECFAAGGFGGATPLSDTLTPGDSPPGGAETPYTAIAASSLHVCALTTGGQAVCGTHPSEQLHYGTLWVMDPPDPAPARYVTISVGGLKPAHLPTQGRPSAGRLSTTSSRLPIHHRGAM